MEVMSIPKLSEKTGVSAYTIRKLVKDGRLRSMTVGNKIFIKVSDFESLFKAEGAK